jgi:dienelactone hydrolase
MLAAFVLALSQATPAAATCAPAAGFVGTICTPEGSGRHPVVIVLGGSGGGDRLAPFARRFAERGYVSASVAYFGLRGLPSELTLIPVETVGTALVEIAQRPDVDLRRIGIFGDSKGGELALLAASTYPDIHAVVGLVPSPFAWSAIPRPIAGAMPMMAQASWSIGGKPVRFVPFDPVRTETGRDAFDVSMERHRGAIPGAMFHLENIRGPVLFLAADDDAVWDSPQQSQIGMDYLRAHNHPYPDTYVHFPHAGHAFLFASPSQPQTRFGGTAAGNVAAEAQGWIVIDDFLDRALAAPATPGT